MEIFELAWEADPTRRFGVLAHRPWAILLDSCRDRAGRGRFDIFSADPGVTLEVRGREAVVTRHGERQVLRGNPFALLRTLLQPREEPEPDGEWPFRGGAMGYFAYELGHACAGLPSSRETSPGYPEMAVGIYDWAVINDHEKRRSVLICAGHDPRTQEVCAWLREHLDAQVAGVPPAGYRVHSAVRAQTPRDEYHEAFARVQEYIRAGDCYQVNLTQKFSARSEGSLWHAYREARVLNPAPYSAYFHHPEVEIASSSPERFLSVRAGEVETRPIKGTLRLGEDPEAERLALHTSAKDRAENLMIVDLLRNDLGKNCATGSITVPELFAVESFATVHQLVSTVRGHLRAGRDSLDLLEGCFPGGSITGAPKRRAMEIIGELEPVPRGVYCGSLGYLGHDGAMDTSIAIRTLVQHGNETSFHAGGGLVADSRADAEYQECMDKAAALRATLEAFRA